MKKSFCLFVVISLFFTFTASAIAAEPKYYDEEIVSLLEPFNLAKNVWHFSEVIGPTLWGTPSEKRTAEDVAALFREYGLTDVKTYPLNLRANGAVMAAANQPELIVHNHTDARAAMFGFPTTFNKGVAVSRGNTSPVITTPADGVTGTVVYCGDGMAATDFPSSVSGQVALIDLGAKTAANIATSYTIARSADAKLVLFKVAEPTTPRGGPGGTGWPTAGSAGTASWANTNGTSVTNSAISIAGGATIPFAFVPDFAANFMTDGTTVTYRCLNTTTYHQTVATIPGPKPDSDIIIFLGHMDTVTAAAGANDNRTGFTAILELARVFKILADKGLTTHELVFAAVGAEESGLNGSTNIANFNTPDFDEARRDRIIACYNFDMSGPGDAYNGGMTLALRQHYGGDNVPPIDDLVSINSLAAAKRLGYTVLDIYQENPKQPRANPIPTDDPADFAVKLTNGSGSDHNGFGMVRSNRFPAGIPNANHSVRLAHPMDGTTHWNSTSASLETRYHAAKDIYWENYNNDKHLFAVRVAAASSYAVTRAASFTVTFNLNGGKGNIEPQEIMAGGKVERPNRPSKKDYDFTGWYTDKNLNDKWDFGDEVTSDMELFAGWEEDVFGCNAGFGFILFAFVLPLVFRRR